MIKYTLSKVCILLFLILTILTLSISADRVESRSEMDEVNDSTKKKKKSKSKKSKKNKKEKEHIDDFENTEERVGSHLDIDNDDHPAKEKPYVAHDAKDVNPTANAFSKEWEARMSDYEPDYVYMIPTKYKSIETFYENITHVPARLRGAFLTDEDSKDQVEFEMRGPTGNMIYYNTTNENIFDITVNDLGRYRITFLNKSVKEGLKVTFTMNHGQNAMLKKSDLSASEVKLDNIYASVKKLDLEVRMDRKVHTERYKKVMKTNKYFYTFSVIETLVLICISMWQFYYMKQLFEVKGTI